MQYFEPHYAGLRVQYVGILASCIFEKQYVCMKEQRVCQELRNGRTTYLKHTSACLAIH